METLCLPEPEESWLTLVREEKWDAYLSALNDEGLTWFFNMDMPKVAIHLAPLERLDGEIEFPERVAFLIAAVNPDTPNTAFEGFFESFHDKNDVDGAIAASIAAVLAIFYGGCDFRELCPWHAKINQCINKEPAQKISPLTMAGALGIMGLVESMGFADFPPAIKHLSASVRYGNEARSPSLILYHSANLGLCHLYAGNLAMMEITLFDAEPFYDFPQLPEFCKVVYRSYLGIFKFMRGETISGKLIHQDIIDGPQFDELPIGLWLIVYNNFLHICCHDEDLPKVRHIARIIQQRSIPERNYFTHSFLHHNLGLASFTLKDPNKALHHCKRAIELCQSSKISIGEKFNALLFGQALSDLGRINEATDHILQCLDKWEESHMHLFTWFGLMELATLMLKKGEIESARQYYQKASVLIEAGEPLRVLNRPVSFLKGIKDQLYPDNSDENGREYGFRFARVRIETLGSFSVAIDDRTLYDRKWRGGRSKMLLKAIIVHGCEKVPLELLSDLLWPDAEGDRAQNSLRVAITRLRRIGFKKTETPPAWIRVRHGRISFVKTLCDVDSVRFRKWCAEAMKTNDMDLLKKALDLYEDDFLVHDIAEAWIVRHREILRNEFIKGVLFLSDGCTGKGEPDTAIPYIQKALEKDPANEELYERMMRIYIGMGYPSKAIHIFQDAEKELKNRWDAAPGAVLHSLAKEARGMFPEKWADGK